MSVSWKTKKKKGKEKPQDRHVFLKKDDVKRALAFFIDKKKPDATNRCFNSAARKNAFNYRCIEPLPGSSTYIAMELRKCMLHQDWTNATRLLLLLLPVAPKIMEPLIWRTCILILFHHPLSTDELREDLVRMTTGVDQVEGILENLLRLSDIPLPKAK